MRVLTYGYDAQLLEGESFQTIYNISLAFTARLRSVGLATPSSKPFLFIAHSLGGIVVKQALVQIANSPDLERTLLAKVKQVIFFGVPNRGMQISHLLPIVKHRPNKPLIRALCKESPYLAQFSEQFLAISLTREMDLVSAYETRNLGFRR
jgi:triacylglycerol esterase/lipase EstA (alpha/beta hydrolase family)